MKLKKIISVILTVTCILSGVLINYDTLTIDLEAASIAGDANEDGIVNVRDAAYIARMAAQNKLDTLPASADYNSDGVVNIRDAAAIAKKASSSSAPKVTTTTTAKTNTPVKTTTIKSTVSSIPSTVYITKTGKRYHYSSTCNGGTYYSCSYKDAIAKGLTPCSKCVH